MIKGLPGVLLLCIVPLFARQPSSICCKMDAMPETASSAHAVLLKVTITNVSTSPVVLFTTSPELDLRFQVKDSDGKEPRLTAYGNAQLNGERRGSRINRELKNGESISQVADLGKLFELAPGEYSVSISRDVFVAESKVVLHKQATIRVP